MFKKTAYAILFLWVSFLIVSWQADLTKEICQKAESGQEQCTPYNLALFLIIEIFKFLDSYSVLITALATIAIGGFTWTLYRSSENMGVLTKANSLIAEKQMLITGRQTDIIEKQHAVGRLQFIADKRPRFHVRHIIIDHPTPKTRHRTPMFQSDKPIIGSLTVVNLGGTEAKIIGSQYGFHWSNVGLPMQSPILDKEPVSLHGANEVSLVAGGSCIFKIQSIDMLGPIAAKIVHQRENWRLYIIGFFAYADVDGKVRSMGFCREYRVPKMAGSEGRFVPVDDCDYEYQD